ncbi:hypothetical protein L208DRAFT_928220 [Tricholoma matsutake]|nr:hypothetical protein L208DRAFT_928220 [Tricholoma matsutake 945]
MVRSVVGCSKAVNWAPKDLLYNGMICLASWLIPVHTASQMWLILCLVLFLSLPIIQPTHQLPIIQFKSGI